MHLSNVQIGRAIERAYQHPKVPQLPKDPAKPRPCAAAPTKANGAASGSGTRRGTAAKAQPPPEEEDSTDSEDEDGQAEERAVEVDKPEITWAMMQRAWRHAGLPGEQACLSLSL